ncbi:MAG: hypothetical protein ACR2N5_05375 [Solirubrobacterales bacterium]
MKRQLAATVVAVGALAVAVTAVVSAAPRQSTESDGSALQAKKPQSYDEDELFIETNATDGDAGLQLNLDAEGWRRLKIIDPKGRTLMDTNAKGKLRNWGLTGMTFESAEPGFDEVSFKKFKKRFPAGKYKFRGETVEGRKLRGADKVSHKIPDQPNITSPPPDGEVSAAGFTITWDPVTPPKGTEIVRYIAIAAQETEPAREMEVPLPGTATSATIPGQFLTPGIETKIEVLAKASNGNQTITEIPVTLK